jgi:DNA primase
MAITGTVKNRLTIEAVLERITPYDVFKMYVPEKNWKINHVICSPLREDENPSLLIGNRNGRLGFVDFAYTEHKGDCFEFVKLLYGLANIDEVLKKIDIDFGLGFNSAPNTEKYEMITKAYKQPEEASKTYTHIQVITRNFTKEELEYWASYYQTKEDLRANGIYSIAKLYLNRTLFYLKPDELRFGYYLKGSWKIYRPFNSKATKWVPNNTPLDSVFGLENLDKNHNTLICKSLKDYMVCRKIYPYVCGVQNESVGSFSQDTIDYIRENSLDVFVCFDSDDAGKKASFAVTKLFNWKHVNPPDRLLPNIKDMADWAKTKGLDEVKQFLITKKIII